MAILEILQGPARGFRFVLERDPVMIGRAPSCGLRIPDRRISRRHLQIAYDGLRDVHVAVDIGSANGATVNGRRLVRGTELQLEDGDEITIGRTRLRYRQSYTRCGTGTGDEHRGTFPRYPTWTDEPGSSE